MDLWTRRAHGAESWLVLAGASAGFGKGGGGGPKGGGGKGNVGGPRKQQMKRPGKQARQQRRGGKGKA